MPTIAYELDTTGVKTTNKITGEAHALTSTTGDKQFFIVPNFAPFFDKSVKLVYRSIDGQTKNLVEGVDYYNCFEFISASLACEQKISGGLLFTDTALNGVVSITEYQTLGGSWAGNQQLSLEMLADAAYNASKVSWEQIAGLPSIFPPSVHQENVNDLKDMSDVIDALDRLGTSISNAAQVQRPLIPTLFQTKHQAGLGNVDNFKTATIEQHVAGVTGIAFATPAGVSAKLQVELQKFLTVFMPVFRSATMPTSGTFNAGNYVANTNPKKLIWQSSSPLGKFNGMTYVVKGWVRMTTGLTHTPDVDWVEDRVIVKD